MLRSLPSIVVGVIALVAACSKPATAGFKAVAGDLPNFATGGVTVLLGQKTN